MHTTTNSRVRRTISRARQIWWELDRAQRRLFEIRTGIPAAPQVRRSVRRQIDELERLYAYEDPRFSES